MAPGYCFVRQINTQRSWFMSILGFEPIFSGNYIQTHRGNYYEDIHGNEFSLCPVCGKDCQGWGEH